MRLRTIAAALAALLASPVLAFDAAKAPLYPSPDLYRPNVDRLTINGEGSKATALAIGGNRGDVSYGLQIGGAVPEDGPGGLVNRLEGHATWQGIFPNRDYASMEFALHPNAGVGLASAAAGTNQLTWVQGKGRHFDPAWVGRKIYFNSTVLRIASIASNGATATVTARDGAAYRFPETVSEVYTVAYVYGTGIAAVAGRSVTRVAGDPFLIYVDDPAFEFRINGLPRKVVSAAPDTRTLTLADDAGTLADARYEFFWDANDQITTFRLHATDQDIENFSIYRRYDGNWLESQIGSYGRYRDIRLTTGELPYSPGSKAQQVVLHRNGGLSLGGDYAYDTLRIDPQTTQRANFFVMIPGATGYGPALVSRGSDPNAALNLDTLGGGSVNMSSNTFGQTTFQVLGTTAKGLNWTSAFAASIPGLQAQGPGTDVPLGVYGKGNAGVLTGAFVRAADPTPADIPINQCADWNNTAAGTYRHVCNFGGALRAVTLN